RLRGNRHAFATRRIHRRESLRAADMHDVRAHVLAGAAHTNEQTLNGFYFSCRRTRPAPGQTIGSGRRLTVEQLLTLGVHADQRAEPGGGLEPHREHAVGDAMKVIDAAMAHERLEANNSTLVEDLEVLEVVGDEASPQPEVHQRLL